MKRVLLCVLLLVLAGAAAWSQDHAASGFPRLSFGGSIEPCYFHDIGWNNHGLTGSPEGPGIIAGLDLSARWAPWIDTGLLAEFDAPYWGGSLYKWTGIGFRLSLMLTLAVGPIQIQPLVGVSYSGTAMVSAGARLGIDPLPIFLHAQVSRGLRSFRGSCGVVIRLGT